VNAIEAFLATRAGRDQPLTQKRYQLILERFDVDCREHQSRWEDQTPESLDLYLQRRAWARQPRGSLYAGNTLQQERQVLRHFYRWAFSSDLIDPNPTQHWILNRPAQPERNLLTRLQIQQLLNLPDVTTPIGQRDQLLMELLYGPTISLTGLHLLTTAWNPDWEPIRATWERYMKDGRPKLQRGESDRLLLSERGKNLVNPMTLRWHLRPYGRQIGVHLDLRILQQTFRHHIEELARRLPQVERPRP